MADYRPAAGRALGRRPCPRERGAGRAPRGHGRPAVLNEISRRRQPI